MVKPVPMATADGLGSWHRAFPDADLSRDGETLVFVSKKSRQAKGETMAEEVRAPIAGTILDVLVEAGATVEADDELVVIEAMKMQNLIYAPVAGTVKAVHVKQGDKVEPDDVLVIIE